MKEMIQNIENDIETVRRYLKKLRAKRSLSSNDVRAVGIYEDMLLQLLTQFRDLKEYIEEADK